MKNYTPQYIQLLLTIAEHGGTIPREQLDCPKATLDRLQRRKLLYVMPNNTLLAEIYLQLTPKGFEMTRQADVVVPDSTIRNVA